jgi:hypothetical protein
LVVADNLAEAHKRGAVHGGCAGHLPDTRNILRVREALETELRQRWGGERAALSRNHVFVGHARHEQPTIGYGLSYMMSVTEFVFDASPSL